MIRIYTDGSCLGNPGPGGWAAVIEENGRKRTLAGREGDTTSNRMEILAAVKGLEATRERAEVTVYSDSQYLVNTMTKGWKRNTNRDLWALLDTVAGKRRIHWEWVRGHVGNLGNEEANALANAQIGLPPESKGRHAAAPDPISIEKQVDSAESAELYVGVAWDPSTKRGAWAITVAASNAEPEVIASNLLPNTNPSRLELTAVVKGLGLAKGHKRIAVRTYSDYLLKCGSGVWERRANKELWQEVEKLLEGADVAWVEDRGVLVAKAHDRAAAMLAGKLGGPQSAAQEGEVPAAQPESASLTHLDSQGHARMVDVGEKEPSVRVAVARGSVRMKPETLRLIQQGQLEKGDVLAVARVAGIMAAKRTPDLIPMCHPIPLDQVSVELEPDEAASSVHITATTRTTAKTGIEMEALTAVAVAALTIYDMAKSVDRGMRIEDVRLVSKRGGKSGDILLEGHDDPL